MNFPSGYSLAYVAFPVTIDERPHCVSIAVLTKWKLTGKDDVALQHGDSWDPVEVCKEAIFATEKA